MRAIDKHTALGVALALALLSGPATAQAITHVPMDDADELLALAGNVLTSLAEVDPIQARALQAALDEALEGESVASRRAFKIQQTLDMACMFEVGINPESRVKVSPGPAHRDLVSGAWRCCLVKVHNMAGVNSPLRVLSEQEVQSGADDRDAWLQIEIYDGDKLPEELTGKLVEYRLVRLRTDEVGYRSAVIAMDVGQGTADIGFRNDTLMTFRCRKP